MSGPRIVSLLPGATELVAELGALDRLVGRSHECDFPARAASVAVMTRPRVDAAKPSADLHQDAVRLIEGALSVFEVDAAALRSARPDVILTQHQCEACAVSEQDLAAALADWTGTRPTVVSTAPDTLEAVWESFTTIGDALDLGQAARTLATRSRSRVAGLSARAEMAKRPAVACIEWIDPPMIAGNWVPEMVTAAGGAALMAEPGAHSAFTALAAIAEADADAFIFMPCGFDLPRTVSEAQDFLTRPEIAGLRAVREGALWAVDGNAYFNRPGPRLVDSVEILADILHPDRFASGLKGTGWAPIRVA